MEQNIVKLQISNEYIQGSGVSVGAVGSHDDVLLEMDFRPSAVWSGTTRRAIFANALGENRTVIVLTTNLMEEGQGEIYLVPVPQQAKDVAGECFLTVEGFVTDRNGKEIVRCVTEEARFRVLPSKLYTNDSAPVTPSQAEQLQAEIDALKPQIILAGQIAENETERVSAEKDRKQAERLRVVAEDLRALAEQERVSNENTRKQAESGRVTAEGERVSAETARETAEQSRAEAEKARVAAETDRVSAENERVAAEQARADENAGIVAQATEKASAAASSAAAAASSAAGAESAAELAMEYATGLSGDPCEFSVAANSSEDYISLSDVDGIAPDIIEDGKKYRITVNGDSADATAAGGSISALGVTITGYSNTGYHVENDNDYAVSGSFAPAATRITGKSAAEYAEEARQSAEQASESESAAADSEKTAGEAADSAYADRLEAQYIARVIQHGQLPTDLPTNLNLEAGKAVTYSATDTEPYTVPTVAKSLELGRRYQVLISGTVYAEFLWTGKTVYVRKENAEPGTYLVSVSGEMAYDQTTYKLTLQNGTTGFAPNSGRSVTVTLKAVDDSALPPVSDSMRYADRENAGIIKVGDGLLISEDGVLSVDTTDTAEEDNTKPMTSAGVYTQIGNIEALLAAL